MKIGTKDIVWNYFATILRLSSSIILLPLILRLMPPEKVGIWSVFIAVSSLSQLLDFGFNSSFTRNITYVFSGAKSLKISGIDNHEDMNLSVDFGLLKSLISAMRWFYSRISIIYLILLLFFGTFYISTLLEDYKYNHNEVYTSWIILVLISTASLYTQYYDSLLQGKGLIKKSKQIIIIANIFYLISAAALIIMGFGLVAIVSSQAINLLIIRFLSHKAFYSNEINSKLDAAVSISNINIIKIIYPNAIKIGLTILGGFLIQKSTIFIGSLYLPLSSLASYGISINIVSVLSSISSIVINTYNPKISYLRITNNYKEIRYIYIKGITYLVVTFIIGGSFLILFGNDLLNILGSKTKLLDPVFLFFILLSALDQANLVLSGNIIVTKNEVPFYKASLITGSFIVLLLLILFNLTNFGLYILVLTPLMCNVIYQSWKWPYVLINDIFKEK